MREHPTFYILEEAAALSGHSVNALLDIACEGKISICLRCSGHHEMSFPARCQKLFGKVEHNLPPDQQSHSAYVRYLMDAHYSYKHGNRQGNLETQTGYISKYSFYTDDAEQNQRLEQWIDKELLEEKAWRETAAKNLPSNPPTAVPDPENHSKPRLENLHEGNVFANETISQLTGYWRIDRNNLFDIQSAIKQHRETRLKLYLYGEAFPYIAEGAVLDN